MAKNTLNLPTIKVGAVVPYCIAAGLICTTGIWVVKKVTNTKLEQRAMELEYELKLRNARRRNNGQSK